MIIYPAIDLKDGKVVRLTQGDYDKVSIFSDEPYKIAMDFEKQGASWLHIVDLDGAKDGELSNFDTIKKIKEHTSLNIQVGGGIRDENRIKCYLDIGVNRVILGTIAVSDPEFLKEMVKKYKEKIAVGVDAKNNKVAVDGWLNTTDEDSFSFCKKLRDLGVETIIYTDISKDGLMEGTNLMIYKSLSAIESIDIIASGGISDLSEIKIIKDMKISGAIIGKAIYLKAIALEDAIKEAKDDN